MSINSEIERIKDNVSDALAATAEMGADVPATANSDDLGTLIRAIPKGGGGSVETCTVSVNFLGDQWISRVIGTRYTGGVFTNINEYLSQGNSSLEITDVVRGSVFAVVVYGMYPGNSMETSNLTVIDRSCGDDFAELWIPIFAVQ